MRRRVRVGLQPRVECGADPAELTAGGQTADGSENDDLSNKMMRSFFGQLLIASYFTH